VNEGTLLFVNFAVYAWLLLLPVAAVEAWELKRGLALAPARAATVSGLANLASTLLCSLAVIGAGWVLGFLDFVAEPQAGEGDLAVLVALAPCFFLSVWAETLVGAALLKSSPPGLVRTAVFRANLLGYSMLGIVPVVRFIKSAVINQRIIW
jgi:hypothetical protein